MLQKEDLAKICNLAKLKVDDANSEQFLEKLNSVFEWIDQLAKIDVSHVDLNEELDIERTPERPDEASMTNTRDELLANSKHKKFDMFAVPKVID